MTQNLMSSLLLFDFSPLDEACITHLKKSRLKKRSMNETKLGNQGGF